jgi:hypothetical protein
VPGGEPLGADKTMLVSADETMLVSEDGVLNDTTGSIGT